MTRRLAFAAVGALAAFGVGLAACSGARAHAPATAPIARAAAPAAARSWTEADPLFRHDARFRGGDAAYTIPLGDGRRTLWLFGDTFFAREPGGSRAASVMVHNAVAIEAGLDPTRASLTFAASRPPASFFADDGPDAWTWPEHGAVVDGRLVVFLARVRRRPDAPLGFVVDGWTARVADDVRSDDPARWPLRPALVDPDPYPVVLGVAVAAHDDVVDVFAVREPGNHALSLVRFSRARFAAGDLRGGEWHGDVMEDAATELSVHREPSGAWVCVATRGFGATDVVERTAPRTEGPWSAPRVVFRAPESRDASPGVIVYAAKAHPELLGKDGALVVTYATNTTNGLDALVGDDRLYYPRFVLVPR